MNVNTEKHKVLTLVSVMYIFHAGPDLAVIRTPSGGKV